MVDTWANASGGNYADPSNWSDGVPNYGAGTGDAVLPDLGTPYTVVVDTNSLPSLDSLTTAYNVTLEVAADFDVTGGYAVVSTINDGTFIVSGAGDAYLQTSYVYNYGLMQLDSGTANSWSALDIVPQNELVNYGTVDLNGPYAALNINGVQWGGTIDNEGMIEATGGNAGYDGLSITGNVTNNGTIAVSGAGSQITIEDEDNIRTSVSGAGELLIGDGGTLLILGSSVSCNVVFGAGGGGLVLDEYGNGNPGLFTGTISGLAVGDVIDFGNKGVTGYALNGDTLTVDGLYTYTLATPLPAGDTFSVENGSELVVTPLAPSVITSAVMNGGLWSLAGSAEARSTVTVYDGSTALGTTTADSGGAWSFPTNEDNSAIRDFSVTATDPASKASMSSAAWFEGTPGNDVFSFASEAALAAPAAIFGDGGSDRIKITAAAALADADFANAHNILTLALTAASSVTLGADADAAGIGKVTTGKGATSIADSNTGTLKVNASALAESATLSLSGSEKFVLTGLQGNLVATNVTGALNVTTAATSALSIATGGGPDTINASAMTQGETLSLTGSHAATVTVGGNLAASAYIGKLTVTASGTAPHTLTTGGGKDSITATNGGDTIAAGGGADTINVSGHTVADSFVYKSVSDSPNTSAGHDTITGFLAGTGAGAINDVLDFSALLGPTYSVQALKGTSAKVNADSIGWIYSPVADQTLIYANTTAGALSQTSGKLVEVALAGDIHLAAANLSG